MRERIPFAALAAVVGLLVVGSVSRAGEKDTIAVRPSGGSGVTIDAPAGFGKWHLTFPENMLLEGPGRGTAKMSSSVADDGTLVFEGRMEGEFAHAIRITYKPGKDVDKKD